MNLLPALPSLPFSGLKVRPAVAAGGRFWALACLLCACSVNLEAAKASFPATVRIDGSSVPQRGTGTFRWAFFKLYDAALYLPAGVASEAAFSMVPKHLEIAYAREIPVEKMIEASDRLLAKNCSAEELEAIAPGLAKINAAYITPREGDRYTLTYAPGEGTVLALNGEPVAFIEGDVFARCYFRIWLGEHPVGRDFRDDLLDIN